MTLYAKLQKDFTSNVLGYSALGIIWVTCLGSIAVMSILMNGHDFLQMFQVFLVVSACTLHNASILTVQKPELIFKLLTISTIISVTLMVANMLFA